MHEKRKLKKYVINFLGLRKESELDSAEMKEAERWLWKSVQCNVDGPPTHKTTLN